jgi:lysophospholipid hydrolase
MVSFKWDSLCKLLSLFSRCLYTPPPPHLTSPHLTSPHLTPPHLISPHLTSPHLISPHLSLPRFSLAPHKSKGRSVRQPVLPLDEAQDVDGSRTRSRAPSMDQFSEPDLARVVSQELVEQFWQASDSSAYRDSDTGQLPKSFFYLASTKFVDCFDTEQFESLYAHVDWHMLHTNTVVFSAGDPSDSGMFIVVEGTVGVFTSTHDNLVQLSEFTRGDSFGESGLYSQDARTFTAITTSDAKLICVSRQLFEKILVDRPIVAVSLAKITIARHYRMADFVLHKVLCIASDVEQDVRNSGLLNYFDPPEEAMNAIASVDNVITVTCGNPLFSRGQMADRMYFVLSGKLCAFDDDSTPSTLGTAGDRVHEWTDERGAVTIEYGPGSIIGGPALLSNTTYAHTIVALHESRVAWITLSDFENHPTEHTLPITYAIVNVLRQPIEVFFSLGLQREWKPAGTFLYRADSPVNEVYVIVSGRVRTFQRLPDGTIRTRFETGMSECAGEVSFLSHQDVRTHDTVCVRDTECVRISRQAFDLLQLRFPNVLAHFASTMARRFRNVLINDPRHKNTKLRVISLFPLSADVDITSFVNALVPELRRFGPTICIDTDEVKRKLDIDLSDEMLTYFDRTRLAVWLNELEKNYRFVVVVGDSSSLLWTRVGTRSADCIYMVGNAQSSPAVSAFEDTMIWKQKKMLLARKELVLLHPDYVALPSETHKWLQVRKGITRHHHVKVSRVAHYARLARYLADRAYALVLSGGGARGLAHLGVMRAMFEEGVPIDYIGGTSQGSFMAAIYSIYEDLKEVEDSTRVLCKGLGNIWNLLMDATFPSVSYFSGKTLNKVIYELLGKDTRIEDLWVPFLCVTTNLSKADLCVHSKGSLWRSVRSSMSILPHLPPMHFEGNMLIDGGYMNNLPVDVMRDVHSPKYVFAIDVENKDSCFKHDLYEYGDHLSGWWLLYDKIMGFLNPCARKRNIPNFSDLIDSLSFISHNRNVRGAINSRLMDVYVRPPLSMIKLLDYHKLEQIAEIGYRTTKAKLFEWNLLQRDEKGTRHGKGIKRARSFTTLDQLFRQNRQEHRRQEQLIEAHHIATAETFSEFKHVLMHNSTRRDSLDSKRAIHASRSSTNMASISAATSPAPHRRYLSATPQSHGRRLAHSTLPALLSRTRNGGKKPIPISMNVAVGSPSSVPLGPTEEQPDDEEEDVVSRTGQHVAH